MKWFTEVFLPSLEDRYNDRGGNMWLTKKQTDVCRRYMEYSATVRGCMRLEVGNKTYSIQVARNGCAHFTILVDGWVVAHT